MTSAHSKLHLLFYSFLGWTRNTICFIPYAKYVGWKNINFPITSRSFIHSTKIYWAVIMSQAMCCALGFQVMNKLQTHVLLGQYLGSSSLFSGQQARLYGILAVIILKAFSAWWALPTSLFHHPSFLVTCISTHSSHLLPWPLPGTLFSPSHTPTLSCYILVLFSLIHFAVTLHFSVELILQSHWVLQYGSFLHLPCVFPIYYNHHLKHSLTKTLNSLPFAVPFWLSRNTPILDQSSYSSSFFHIQVAKYHQMKRSHKWAVREFEHLHIYGLEPQLDFQCWQTILYPWEAFSIFYLKDITDCYQSK